VTIFCEVVSMQSLKHTRIFVMY